MQVIYYNIFKNEPNPFDDIVISAEDSSDIPDVDFQKNWGKCVQKYTSLIEAIKLKDYQNQAVKDFIKTVDEVYSQTQEHPTLSKLSKGKVLYRCRKHDDSKHINSPYVCCDIGYKKQNPLKHNRYGDMFYLGENPAICFAELDCKDEDIVTIGKFKVTRELNILNLIDGLLFDSDDDNMYFFTILVRNIFSGTEKIDCEVNYEICGLLADKMKSLNIDGIIYKSSRYRDSMRKCFAFYTNTDIKWISSRLVKIQNYDMYRGVYKISVINEANR